MADFHQIADRILLGEPLRMIAADHRNGLLVDMGFDPEEAPDGLFVKETTRFMNQVCRHLGDRHAGDQRAAHAMEEWVRRVNEYDAFDVLLTHFDFDTRPVVLERGRMLFPGPLTAHWGDRAAEW